MFVVAILIPGVMSKSDDAVSNISRVVRRHQLNQGLKHQARFVKDLAKNCVADECDILHTLLSNRGSWHPAAPTLLEKVSSRRLSSSVWCHDRETEDACTQSKPALVSSGEGGDCKVSSCMWNPGDNSCWDPNCGFYSSSDACCENALNVPGGCHWQANGVGHGYCTPMSCYELREDSCASVKGCKFECNECVPDHYTECSCSPENPDGRCEMPGPDPGASDHLDLQKQMASLLNCPSMSCSMCLKAGGGGMSVPDEETIKVMYAGVCNKNCTDIAQCEAEAVCMMSSQDQADLTDADLDNYEQCKVMPSCVSELTTTTTTTTSLSDDEMCVQSCDDFDQRCNTCGGEAPCGSSSGARRAGLCMMDTVGGSFMLSVVGMILFVHTA